MPVADPWAQAHAGMMGPLAVAGASKKTHSFLAFTAAGPATGWLECAPAAGTKPYAAASNAFF